MNAMWMRGFVWLLVWCPVALAFAAALPTTEPESVGFSSERLTRIKPVIQGEIDNKQYPGAVMLVARGGQIIYFDSVGLVAINRYELLLAWKGLDTSAA